jgi:hypothetical protein
VYGNIATLPTTAVAVSFEQAINLNDMANNVQDILEVGSPTQVASKRSLLVSHVN